MSTIKRLQAKLSDASGEELKAYMRWEKHYQRSVSAWAAYKAAARRTTRVQRDLDKAGELVDADAVLAAEEWPKS